MLRAGWSGAIAAFVAFTLPSALILFGFAQIVPYLSGQVGAGVIHGLKLVALVFVAQAVTGMARQLCPDAARRSLAIFGAVIVLLSAQASIQLAVIAAGAVAGLFLRTSSLPGAANVVSPGYGRSTGMIFLIAFGVLLAIALAMTSTNANPWTLSGAFYRAGALVFGGGHVVLPMLEETVVGPGWVPRDAFLAGYGAAQAIPGPLFSIAGYLGAHVPAGPSAIASSTIALLAIFLPGFLLLAGTLPFWHTLSTRPRAGRAIAGANAAVVGVLAAALYDPVFTSAVTGTTDIAIGLIGWLLLAVWRRPPLVAVLWCVLAGIATAVNG